MISFWLTLFALLIAASAKLFDSSTDYCRKCTGHVGCNPIIRYGRECTANANGLDSDAGGLLRLTDDDKQLILDVHNDKRNMVATGQIHGFASARRMATMQWNNELAYLAALHAIKCQFKHDNCRRTDSFPWAGQNIAIQMQSNNYPETAQAIRSMLNDWFNEYNVTQMNDIRSYQQPSDGRVIGHFTTMVQDKQTHVGCAAINFQMQRDLFAIYLICNYAMTNILEQPVYATGTPCSGCTTGCNDDYPALCSATEMIRAVPLPLQV